MLRTHVIWAVFRRNVASYFSGVLGYLFIVVFVVAAAGLAYTPEFFANNAANLDQLNEMFPLLLLFIVPAITMSAWADEKKLGTQELLFTLPASDLEILLGKYLSVLAVYTVALGFSIFQLFVLSYYADPDWGLLATTYFGYWLSGATLLSAGMFASALTASTTVAFVLGVAICAVPVFIGQIPGIREFVPVVRELSLSRQFSEFALGMVPLNGLIYFVTLTAFMLYLNYIVISRRHWSGDQQAKMGLHYLARTVSLVVILASLNLISRASADVLNLRVDMTAGNVYSLSGTTKELLRSVSEKNPVTIQAFLSENVPGEYVTLRKRLVGLLRQYDRIGGDDVEVRIVNAEPYSKQAEEAQAFGIRKRQVQTERAGRYELAEFYLGAAVTSPFDEVVIAAFDSDTPIEYELTSAVRTVSGKKRRTVGVLRTDAGVMGGFDRTAFHSLPSWILVDELKKQYDVVGVSPDEPYDQQNRLFSAKAEPHVEALNSGQLSDELLSEFQENDVELDSGASVETETEGEQWRIVDEENDRQFVVSKQDDELIVYGGFDVLLAVLPSSLTQTQMGRFVDAVRDGQPTLIFDDPAPIMVGLQHAPMVPKPRPGGMFSQGPPPEQRADNGLATTLMNALDIRWHRSDEVMVVWDFFNPHPKIERLLPPHIQPEFIFITKESGVRTALHPESKITEGLDQLLMPFPGRVNQVEDSDLEFEALLRTSTNSGELRWSEVVDDSGSFLGAGGIRLKPNPPRFADEYAHTLAAHIYEDDDSPSAINVVYVADADCITDYALSDLPEILRRAFDYEVRLDNLEFVLNAVDLLAGDTESIELRNREPRSRPLTEIQEQVNEYRRQRQKAVEELEKEWEKRIEEVQAELDEAQEKLDEDASFSEQAQQMFTQAEVATRKLEQRREEIEEEKQQQEDRLRGEERRKIEALETRIRWQAVLLPPIPALLLGVAVLGIRLYREERAIQPSRSKR